MKPQNVDHETWLDLSQAAEYLGVHFTTLRRWANAGKIPCIRTPGGRRRFSVSTLDQFVQQMARSPSNDLTVVPPLQERAVKLARESVRSLPAQENWLARMSDEQRLRMKGTGHRLMALLLQYNGHNEGGDAFVEEGRRITGEYSQVCASIGITLPETVGVFLFFRRSILDAIHETGSLAGYEDAEGMRLFSRTTDFLDVLLVHLISSYQQAQTPISE